MVNLQETSIREVVRRGLKKIIIELTSVKFLLLVFLGVGVIWGKIEAVYAIPAMLLLVGIKEGAEIVERFSKNH